MTMSCVSWCGRRLLLGLASTSRVMTARQMSAAAGKLGGKVAIVTASTEGIGYGIAQSLATHGASVMVCSRKVSTNQFVVKWLVSVISMLQASNVEAAVSKLRADGHTVSGVVCHVGKREDRDNLIQETVAQYGGLDILVSNAAVNPYFGSSSRVQSFQY